jgi:hypothetical protein
MPLRLYQILDSRHFFVGLVTIVRLLEFCAFATIRVFVAVVCLLEFGAIAAVARLPQFVREWRPRA